jgi:hypothetical protein
MNSFLTDNENDLYLNITDSGGNAVDGSILVMGTNAEALRQVIVNRVRLQKGEYQYNLNRGIDYTGLLLTDKPLVRLWQKEVLDLVKNIAHITGITYFNYGVKDTNFIFRLAVSSDYGTIEIKG